MNEATEPHISNEFSTPVDGLSYTAETVVKESIDTGEATSRGYYSPQFSAEYVVKTPDVQYYRVEITSHDTAEMTGYEYSAEIGVNKSAVSDDETIHSFVELPAQDRESLHRALGRTELLHAPHYESFSVVFAYERNKSREESAFVSDTAVQYVDWDGVLVHLEFDEQRQVQVTSTTVTIEPVAESPEAFVEHIGDEWGVVLAGLTGEQREIVTQALDEEYTECEPYSEPFRKVLDKLSISDSDLAPLVQYQTNWYFAHLS